MGLSRTRWGAGSDRVITGREDRVRGTESAWKKRNGKLEALGFLVFCIDRTEQIEEVLREIQRS